MFVGALTKPVNGVYFCRAVMQSQQFYQNKFYQTLEISAK